MSRPIIARTRRSSRQADRIIVRSHTTDFCNKIGQQQERNRAENQADRERTGQAERAEQGRGEQSARTGRNAEREDFNRGVQGEESRGRETELGRGAREGETASRAGADRGRFASISREQSTRIHSILVPTAQSIAITARMWISRSRSEPRIPDTIEFYDPPAQVVQIDPVFQGYKIVVLDDVILVVDPATREIVDVIRACESVAPETDQLSAQPSPLLTCGLLNLLF